jgi:hypothetical protein
VGAEFRDDETKIMFAYDYENRHTIRVRQGAESDNLRSCHGNKPPY